VELLLNLLTIDFEEWYHPEYVRHVCPKEQTDNSRQDLSRTLSFLERCKTEATFFIVGEIAQRNPDLITQLRDSRHEIAFHGFDHEPLWNKNAEMLRSEIELFSSIIKKNCRGFRAPSFSLDHKTAWALKVLEDTGYTYDSSVFPAKTFLYGVEDAPLGPYKPSQSDLSREDPRGKIWEFPLLVYSTFGLRLPVAGGFYLRLLPVSLILRAIRKANQNGNPAVLYCHTWELNPETPKLKLGLYKSFVTYHNLQETSDRLYHVLSRSDFTSIGNYMEETGLL